MTILFLSGTTNKETKARYIASLTDKVSNVIYLNIDHVIATFSQPTTSPFTDSYSYAQRIVRPSHETILGFTQDNLPLGKIVMLDGDFDYELTANLIEADFPQLRAATIKVIYVRDDATAAPVSLNKLTTTPILILDTTDTLEKNISAIVQQLQAPEEKAILNDTLVMTAGLGGVGKTTHIKPICQQIPNSIFLDSDIPTAPFLSAAQQPLASDFYGLHIRNQRNTLLFAFAADNLNLHRTAIVDGCFGDKLTSQLVQQQLENPKYVTTAIYFHCKGPTQHARIVERNAVRDIEKLKDLPADRRNNLQKHLVELTQVEDILHIDTDNNNDKEKNIARILQYINAPKPLVIQPRGIPFEKGVCDITIEEAQGGLTEFQALLTRARHKDIKFNRLNRFFTSTSTKQSITLKKYKSDKPEDQQRDAKANAEFKRIQAITTIEEKMIAIEKFNFDETMQPWAIDISHKTETQPNYDNIKQLLAVEKLAHDVGMPEEFEKACETAETNKSSEALGALLEPLFMKLKDRLMTPEKTQQMYKALSDEGLVQAYTEGNMSRVNALLDLHVSKPVRNAIIQEIAKRLQLSEAQAEGLMKSFNKPTSTQSLPVDNTAHEQRRGPGFN